MLLTPARRPLGCSPKRYCRHWWWRITKDEINITQPAIKRSLHNARSDFKKYRKCNTLPIASSHCCGCLIIGCFLLLTRVCALYLESVCVDNGCLDPAVKELAGWQAGGVHIFTHKGRGLSCEMQPLLSFYGVMAPHLLITYFCVSSQSQHSHVNYPVVRSLWKLKEKRRAIFFMTEEEKKVTDLLQLLTHCHFFFISWSSACRVEYYLNENRLHVSVISLLNGC